MSLKFNGVDKKVCTRCKIYFLHDGLFCPYCGMRLRVSPVNKRDRKRLREIQYLVLAITFSSACACNSDTLFSD